jgi:L-ascorbate metabolism protein UlaG (beta-lactamase superfamily)
MQVEWYGQSAFRLTDGTTTVFIDPFDDLGRWLESPIGEVLAVAAEHDDAAGTERGPNTLFAFTLGGRRIAHLGDLGQAALRDEQARALGAVDLLFVPSGDGPLVVVPAAP